MQQVFMLLYSVIYNDLSLCIHIFASTKSGETNIWLIYPELLWGALLWSMYPRDRLLGQRFRYLSILINIAKLHTKAVYEFALPLKAFETLSPHIFTDSAVITTIKPFCQSNRFCDSLLLVQFPFSR